MELNVVAPVTPNVELNVVAPVTPNVELNVVALSTCKVESIVVAPPIERPELKDTSLVAHMVPEISKLVVAF